jgi:hypothetical protein
VIGVIIVKQKLKVNMKVIFLDNDGVICLADNWGSRMKKFKKYHSKNPDVKFDDRPIDCRLDNFDVKAIKVLNTILEQTGAEIVVSSDWRYQASLEELGDYYQSQGIIKRPIGVTDMFKDIYPREWQRLRNYAKLEYERQAEIKHWLSQHPEVTHWVAVDDLDMSEKFGSISGNPNSGLTNFVLTPKSTQGIKQSGIKEKILKFLM